MRAVAIRVLREVLLEVVLGQPITRRRQDLDRDARIPARGKRRPLADAAGLGRRLLRIAGCIVRRAVLSADIVPLAITLRGVMVFPEVAQQLRKAHLVRPVHDRHSLGVLRAAAAGPDSKNYRTCPWPRHFDPFGIYRLLSPPSNIFSGISDGKISATSKEVSCFQILKRAGDDLVGVTRPNFGLEY